MADQTQSIKRRIRSIESAERITDAMRVVAAAKLRKTRKTYESVQQYLYSLIRTMTEIFGDTEEIPQEFLAGSRDVRTDCCIVITGSKGFCGSFNNDVIRFAEEYLDGLKDAGRRIRLITIGSKGRDCFRYRGFDILTEYEKPVDTVTFEEAARISRSLVEMYLKGETDSIDMIHTSYINPLKQEAVIHKLLPFSPGSGRTGGVPYRYVQYEPSPDAVFRYLIPKYTELVLYCACIESAACEYAARRSAMESAHDNAHAMLEKLGAVYNRTRQAKITNELMEIVAGSQAKQ